MNQQQSMHDHAPRLRERNQQAANDPEKLLAILFWAVGLAGAAAIAGWSIYEAGFAAALRSCPPAQYGERLMSLERHSDENVCFYANGWGTYGRTVKPGKAR